MPARDCANVAVLRLGCHVRPLVFLEVRCTRWQLVEGGFEISRADALFAAQRHPAWSYLVTKFSKAWRRRNEHRAFERQRKERGAGVQDSAIWERHQGSCGDDVGEILTGQVLETKVDASIGSSPLFEQVSQLSVGAGTRHEDVDVNIIRRIQEFGYPLVGTDLPREDDKRSVGVETERLARLSCGRWRGICLSEVAVMCVRDCAAGEFRAGDHNFIPSGSTENKDSVDESIERSEKPAVETTRCEVMRGRIVGSQDQCRPA
jgi:hypothetical protein